MEKYWDISLFVIAVFAILTAVVAITCARFSHKDNDEMFGFLLQYSVLLPYSYAVRPYMRATK